MERLTTKEEEIMQIIWNLGKCYVKDIIEQLPDPKPPYTTVSSIVRILEGKEFVGHAAYGNTHQYYPLVAKEDFRKKTLKSLVKDYYDNSFKSVVSFLIEEEKLTSEDVAELTRIIKKNKKEKMGNDNE